MKKLLLLIIMSFALNSFSLSQPTQSNISGEEKVMIECDQRVFYEIFMRSFYDSNGDGIGDLKGITSRLDYLQSLGIGGLWLTPFNPAPSYHKYDVLNYYGVDTQYGTIEDFKELVKEAHKRDILVLMDLVANHTSWQHPWFQKSIKNDPVYRNFYYWKADPPASDANWYLPRDASGQQISGEKYYGFFWRGMPDLNYDNPAVRDTMIEIGKWWLRETSIDGFRLDAAQHIYEAEDTASNNNWWKQFTVAMKTVKPDVITIGEVWNKRELVATYLKSLSGCFNFELSWDLLQTLRDEKNDKFIEKLIQTRAIYQQQAPYFIDPIFLSNHDANRIMSDLGNNVDKAKLAASIYLTLPGTPFIYYGEELGMRGMKPDSLIREPFPWNENGMDHGQTTWEKFQYNSSANVEPLSVQMKIDSSMFQHYNTLVALRKNNSALTSKNITSIFSDQVELIAYTRGDETNQLLVIHNISGKPLTSQVTDDLSDFRKFLFRSNSEISLKENIVTLPAYSSAILRK